MKSPWATPNDPRITGHQPEPLTCRRCREVPAAEDSFGYCRACLLIEERSIVADPGADCCK